MAYVPSERMSRNRNRKYKYSASTSPTELASDRAEQTNPRIQRKQTKSLSFPEIDKTYVEDATDQFFVTRAQDIRTASNDEDPAKAISFKESSPFKETTPDVVESELEAWREEEKGNDDGRRTINAQDRPMNARISNQSNLRPDAVALGFVDFEQKLDHSRILCIYERDVENSVSMVFFHVEGMAAVFGVGLPFCRVKLYADSVVEIREIQEGLWMDYWTKKDMKDSSHAILFDSSNLFIDRGGPSSALTSQVPRLSTEQSAELFGVGMEDIDAITNDEDLQFQVLSNADAVPPAWLRQLHEFMSENGHDDTELRTQRSESVKPEDGSDHSRCIAASDDGKNRDQASSSSETMYSAKKSNRSNSRINEWFEHNPLFEGQSSNQRVQTEGDGNDEISENQQYLQLTVKVILDPVKYSIYSPSHRKNVRLRKPESGSRKMELFYPPAPSNHDPEDTEIVHMSDHQMVPKVTVNFLYEPVGNGYSRRKRLKTSLKANFHMDGSIAEEEYFGWYHDQLRLSLECLEPNAVRRNTKAFDKEILSELRISMAQRVLAQENQDVTARSEHHGVQLKSGDGLFGSCFNASFKRAKRKEHSSKKNAADYNEFEVCCLRGSNFSILKNELNAQELAYRASIHPPISYTNMWDLGQRQLAHSSGIMSTIPLSIQGHWTVKNQQHDDPWTDTTLCDYAFLCQRDLIRHQKCTATTAKSSLLCFGPSGKNEVESQEKIWLQQKLWRRFLINHSFSHMSIQRLKMPGAYKWDLTIHDFSPVMALLR